MNRKCLLFTMLLACLMAVRASGENSISLDLWQPWHCLAEHRLGIRIKNDVPLKSLTVPLVVRGLGIAGLTSIRLSFDQRLSGAALSDVRETNLYFTEDGTCKSGQLGGFATVAFTDTLTHAAPGTPFGILFHAATFGSGYLPAGEDALVVSPDGYLVGSLVMTLTFDHLWASIDIDTTCMNPANHLLYLDASDQPIVPVVTIGTIHRDWFCISHGDLDLDGWITAIDLGREIDYLFAAGPILTEPNCDGLADGGDFNCDGFPDAIDLAGYIDHLFAGGQGPCDPELDCAPCRCGYLP